MKLVSPTCSSIASLDVIVLQSHCLPLRLADNREMTRVASSERLGAGSEVLVLQVSIPCSFLLSLGVLNVPIRNYLFNIRVNAHKILSP